MSDMPSSGDFVSISARYVRKSRTKPCKNENHGSERWKVWERTQITMTDCLFLGTRTLSNGVVDIYYGEDGGITFNHKERFQAAVVCPGPRRANVLVPLDAVECERPF